jgi:Fe-S-cluster-containing dehydrogenase component
MCVHACPFGVLTVDANGRGVLKCDLCVERLAEGQEPACVAGCPTKAVTFEEEVETTRTKRQRSAAMVVAAQEESIVD